MSKLPADLARAVELGGEMGRRFAAYEWATHPLGDVSDWSAEFRTTVAAALTSRFPIVLWLGSQDLFLVYNDAYISMLGEKHPAALGVAGRDVWWDIWDSIGPMLGGVTETGEATWSDDLLLPITTAGRPHERYFTFSYGPIVTGAGQVDGIFCAVNETTERVLGGRRLQVLNTVAAALMETRTVDDAVLAAVEACAGQPADLPFVAFYVDDKQDGTTRLRGSTPAVANLLPATLSGLAPGMAGSGHRVLEDLPGRLPGLSAAFPVGAPEQALVLPMPDSGQVSVGGALVVGLNPRQPLTDQYRGFCRLLGDQVTAALAAASLYERERQRADALAELDRAKTTFLANVSHEFRTPLTLMLGPVEEAMAATRDEPKQLERLDTVRRNAQRLMRLVNSLLDFSRIEAGGMTANPVPVDLGALTAQIASSFTELCQRAGIDLVVRCPPVLVAVDVQMWETIVLNLLSNAVKFTPEGSITVEVTPGPGEVSVRIADTGIGIARDEVSRLFERFYRGSNTRARSAEGSGIGLSLVRSLVELHGGTIGLDSDLNVGTTVTIRLPPAAADAVPTAAPPTATDNPYVAEAMQWVGGEPTRPFEPTGRPLVLIADDNADMRRHLDRILSEHWDTVAFGDGAAALRGVHRYHPDVVVTDVMMPGLDGLGLTSAIRDDPRLASIPILMLSARAGLEAAEQGFGKGADDYLPKPFSSADLVNRVTARLTAVARDRTSREHDEARARQATALAEFRAALGAANTVEDVMAALVHAPVGSLGATSVSVGMTEDELERIRITYAGAMPAELRDRYHVVAMTAPLPVADVIRTGTPMTISDTQDLDRRYEVFLHDTRGSLRAAVIHPLRDASDTVVGALGLYWPEPRPFEPPELDLLARIAAEVGSTLQRVRTVQREHRIASDFQDHLLDLDRGSTAAVVSAVYQPAGEAMRVGGDWYLVIPLDDPARVAVSVGDVVSHGLPAATVMSKLRSAITAGALTDADPRALLHLLERYAARVPGASCSTVAYAVVDTDTHQLSYACAGHLPPLLLTPDGVISYLEDGRRSPLAARALTGTGDVGHADLPAGSLVILYTDGLIERPGESLDDGLARLAQAAAGCATLPVETVCATLLARLAPPGGYTDDVVVLALRPAGVTSQDFVAALPATRAEMPPLRHRMRDWLAALDLGAELEYDVLLGVGEAVSNAIEHGSRLDAGMTVSVEAFADAEQISVTVSDSGQWSSDSSASRRASARGRGLMLINGLSERVDTVRTARGTHVTLHYRRDAGADTGAAAR